MGGPLRNLITNPNFATNLTGWTTFEGVALTREALAAYGSPSGGWYAYTRRSTAGDLTLLTTVNSPVEPGREYTASIYHYRDSAGTTDMTIDWYNGATFLGNSGFTSHASQPAKWRRVWATAVAPATANGARLVIVHRSMGANAFTRIGGAMINEGWMDGYGDGGSLGWVWDGTANQSTSTRVDAQYTFWPHTGNIPLDYYTGSEIDGLEFWVKWPCRMLGMKYYRVSTSVTGTVQGQVYTAFSATSGTAIAGTLGTFTLGTTVGWKQITFAQPIELVPWNRYKAVVRQPSGRCASVDPTAMVGGYIADAIGAGFGAGWSPLYIPARPEAYGASASSALAAGSAIAYPTGYSGYYYGIDVIVDEPYQDGLMSFF